MTDVIILAILAVIITAAARYVYKAKKSGAKCIGCSVGDGSCCAHKHPGESCGCGGGTEVSACCCHTDTK